MATTRWTPAQEIAIENRDRTMLLSAAAGSGKTAVLTERIIRSLLDPNSPLDLSRILAVTFTRSAAQEMRHRIGKKLTEAMERDPNNAHLANQIRLLPGANISTIDSFCIGILRRFASIKQLSPAFRVADEQETKLLRIAIMEELIRDGYAGKLPSVTSEDFASFVRQVTQIKEEPSLGEKLLKLLTHIDSFETGADTLFTYAEKLEMESTLPLHDTSWWKLAMEQLETLCHHYATLLHSELNLILDEKLLSNVEGFCQVFEDLPHQVTGATLSYTFPKLIHSTGYKKSPEEEQVLRHAREGKDKLKELENDLFSSSIEEWARTLSTLAKEVLTLARICRAFQGRYEGECRRRAAFDFSTISRFTYQLLIENPSIAASLKSEYDAVYVDEYQDVNPLQHAIFEMIAPETGRFLVGDIKQAIYRFRQADPTIFSRLRREFPPLDPIVYTTTATHFMSQNFRSDKSVVDLINVVFDFLFTHAGASIHYQQEDRLDCGKNQEGVVYSPTPIIAFFDSKMGRRKSQEELLAFSQKVYEGEPIPDTTPEDISEAEGIIHREAMWIAGQIHALLQETRSDGITPIKASDIAILIRSANTRYKPYVEALALYGIPCEKPQNADFFASPEVLLTLALLNTIENPLRDIYLTATLCSPLYGFTADDLAELRLDTPKGIPLYDALRLACDTRADFVKGHFFLRQLDSFRQVAETIPVDQLLRRLFDETPLMAIAGAENPNGENNLKLLYNYARTYQGAAFSGLYGFIRFLDKQIESGATFTPRGASEDAGGVRISTIHGSKGLQYPVVFVADCGSPMDLRDISASMICDQALGVSFFLRDPSGAVRCTHPIHKLLQRFLTRQSFEEEMRLLYVALTRAEERLFITGTVKRGYLETAQEKAEDVACFPSSYSLGTAQSYMHMILSALFATREKEAFTLLLDPPVDLADGVAITPTIEIDPEEVEKAKEILQSRFDFSYPHAHLAGLPKKLSVSRLKPDFLDLVEEETAILPPAVKEIDDALPEEETGAKKWNRLPVAYAGAMPPDPTDRGIATHLFMQFCDFENLQKNGVEEETRRLLNRGYLDERLVDLMRPKELEKFRRSDLLRTMCEASRIWREFRFNIKLPAALFAQDPLRQEALAQETVFVQGVMDALIQLPNGDLILVDYKTDRFTREEKENPALAAKKMRARHSTQLSFYGEAVKAIFGKSPVKTLVYALELGYTIQV